MLRFFNRTHPSALIGGFILLAIAILASYHFGDHSWLLLEEELLPIGGRLLSKIPFSVGFPLSYALLILGSVLARLLLIRYVSGISHSYLLVVLLPLLLGGLGMGAHNLLPPLVALLFLVFALAMILQSAQAVHVLSRVFLISVLIGFSSLFYLPALFFACAPVLILLNRGVMSLRGILLIVAGIFLTGATVFFVCWLTEADILQYYPVALVLGIRPGDMMHWVICNPARPLYVLWVFLLWLPMILRMRSPHKVHRTSYLLVYNIFIWDFLIALFALFFVRDPFYMLPITFAFLGAMICYTLTYSTGRLANLLFFLILSSAFTLHFI